MIENMNDRYWDNITFRRNPNHPVVEAFAKPKVELICQEIEHKGSLLEVGCGNGYLTIYLDKLFDVTALDRSQRMLDLNPHQRKVLGEAEDLPFGDNTFDIVLSANLLHHLNDPSKAVLEMSRVCKEYFVSIEPNCGNPFMFAFSALKKIERGALKFNKHYMKELLHGMDVKLILNHGSVVPNKMPTWILPITKNFNRVNHFGFYTIAIAKKKNL